ncbi:hypothetical protein EJ07DRAFT_164649 [Lizonia empirigonia]|nr:hypothetical protein EJ07DRAFT_164649 [Lizonia empirigonia]
MVNLSTESLLALIWASAALATPYALDMKYFTSPSMADCMEHCSRYWGDGEGCYSVVWREDNKCWIRNSNTTVNGVVDSSDGTHSALVAANTYDKISTTLQCDKFIGGNHAGIRHFIDFFHATTLEECVRICVDQSPLCKGVSWNPGYEIGFANCWPKTGFSDNDLSTPPTKDGVLHSVTITSFDRVDANCRSSNTYAATNNNNNFEIHCGQLNEGTNITSIHTQNITSCMDSSNSNSSSSKSWIAGPVLGSLAFILLVSGALFLYRRRTHARPPFADKHPSGYDARAPYLGAHGAGASEVDGAAARSELPASTKYAMRAGEVHEVP